MKQKVLIGLLLFSALASIAGGISIILGRANLPQEYLLHTDFKSYYFAGVILMAVVGGSALIAAIAQIKKLVGASLATVVAGVIMQMWIVGEIVSIRHLNFLQVIFFAIGTAVIILAPKDEIKSKK